MHPMKKLYEKKRTDSHSTSLRVSRLWHQRLSAIPRLWVDLDFYCVTKPIRIRAVESYISNAKGLCSSLTLAAAGVGKVRVLLHTLQHCTRLQTIEICSGFGSLHPVPVDQFIQLESLQSFKYAVRPGILVDDVARIINACPKLQRLELNCALPSATHAFKPLWEPKPNIQSFTLDSGCENGRKETLDCISLTSALPNVVNLCLRGWRLGNLQDPSALDYDLGFSRLAELKSLDISNNTGITVPLVPLSLESLILDEYRPRVAPLDREWENTGNLKHLSVVKWKISHPFPWISSQNLEYLNVSDFCFSESSNFQRMLVDGAFSELTQLRMQLTDTDDDLALLVAQHMPGLKSLDLSFTFVTGVAIRALVTNLDLDYLSLDGCWTTSVDAVEWARSQGVRVDYNLSDDRMKGRKVRYG